MLFSVVIPVCDSEFSLAETLDSVRRQTWRNFEALIVDDGSTDNSLEIARSFERRDSRFRLLHAPRRFGLPAGPRNHGIRASNGDYVAFLDSDDVWRPDKLAFDAAFLEVDRVDLVFSGCDYFLRRPEQVVASLDPQSISRSFFFRNLVMIQTVCVDQRVFVEQGLYFDEHPKLRAIEDYHFLLEAYLRGINMARRPGTDVLYRANSPTSIRRCDNLSILLSRHAWNLRLLRRKYGLPMTPYLSYMALTLLYKTAQFALGRA